MLLDTLQSDLILSLKSGDKAKTETLRFLIAAIKKFEIDTYPPSEDGKLTEADVLKIIQKQVKTHKESIEAFKKGNRSDLVAKEEAELKILEGYAPKEMSDEEIRVIVKQVKASGIASFGQIMGAAMKQVAGRAPGERVGRIVKGELQ